MSSSNPFSFRAQFLNSSVYPELIHPSVNLTFNRIMIEVKLTSNFCLHLNKWLCLKIGLNTMFSVQLSKVFFSFGCYFLFVILSSCRIDIISYSMSCKHLWSPCKIIICLVHVKAKWKPRVIEATSYWWVVSYVLKERYVSSTANQNHPILTTISCLRFSLGLLTHIYIWCMSRWFLELNRAVKHFRLS